MITAVMTGLSCAIVGFLLPFMTALALANAAPETELEEVTFRRVTIVWLGSIVLTFFAVAWLFGVAFYHLTS